MKKVKKKVKKEGVKVRCWECKNNIIFLHRTHKKATKDNIIYCYPCLNKQTRRMRSYLMAYENIVAKLKELGFEKVQR